MSTMSVPLEWLVREGRDVECSLSEQELATVADLVLRLHQDHARRAGAVLPARLSRGFAERDETERDGMQAAVSYVIRALVLLGYIEMPS